MRLDLFTLYPLALLDTSSTLLWMSSMGLDMVGMFSFAVPAVVESLTWSVMIFCVFMYMDSYCGGYGDD